MSYNILQVTKEYYAGQHVFYTVGASNELYEPLSNQITNPAYPSLTIINGNLGIGTTIPIEKLHIEGNIYANGTIRASNLDIIGDSVILNTITSNTEQLYIRNDGTGPALKVTQTGDNSVAEFYDNESGIALFVGNNGNVGIGTTNPQASLHVNGNLTTANYGWQISASGASMTNATYTAGLKWGKSGQTGYFNFVHGYNGANINAWDASTGLFTFPLNGIYMIIINMFINSSTSGRWGIITFTSNILPLSQYLPFEPTALGANNTRNFSIIKSCNKGDTFYVSTESGSVTLYLADIHTNFIIYKIG